MSVIVNEKNKETRLAERNEKEATFYLFRSH